jgi:hypothetical protein
LLDEVDLANAIHEGTLAREATGKPTLVLLKGIEPAQIARYARKDVELVDVDAEQFFKALHIDVAAFRKQNPQYSNAPVDLATVANFNQQFVPLGLNGAGRANHDFEGGDAPIWNDVLEDLDGQRLTLTKEVEKYLSDDNAPYLANKILFVTSKPGCGKSTALFRLARTAISRSIKPYLFRRDEKLNVEVALAWAGANRPCLFIFDDGGDYTIEIAELVAKANSKGLRVLVALSGRRVRRRGIVRDFSVLNLETVDLSPLRSFGAQSVAEKRRLHARLGKLAGASKGKVDHYFLREHGGDLFAALSDLEQGTGFRGRMDAELSKHCKSTVNAALVTSVACIHALGYALPFNIAAQCAAISVNRLRALVKDGGELSELVVVSPRGLVLRHRVLAEHYLREHAGHAAATAAMIAVLKLLAPLVTPQTIQRRQPSYLIVRSAMDLATVLETTGSVSGARDFYEELRPYCGWNARYWEQRALLESKDGDHQKAYSYAKQSVAIYKDSFTYNTLGTVRMRASLDRDKYPNLDQRWDFFLEGQEALRDALRLQRGATRDVEHPLETFFVYGLKLLREIVGDAGKRDLFSTVWVWWEEEAQSKSKYFPTVGPRLEAWKRLRLTTMLENLQREQRAHG